MFLKRMFYLTVTCLLLSLAALSQTASSQITLPANPAQTKTAKLKNSLLEKITKDAATLKLAENRAAVYARLGNLYWKTDQNRGRDLFNRSISELMTAFSEGELELKNGNSNQTFFTAGSARRQILQLIVLNDKELGFEAFIKSRPQLITDLLAGKSLPDTGRVILFGNSSSPEEGYIRQENDLELTLAMTIIGVDSAKAIEILRRSSPANITPTTYYLLRNLRQKDRQTADALAQEIIKKILASDFAKFPNSLYFVNQFLTSSTLLPGNAGLTEFQIDAATVHALAEKEADFLIKNANSRPDINFENILMARPTLTALLPERAAELNAVNLLPRSGGGGASSFSFSLNLNNTNFQELIKDGTPEKIAVEAEKYQPAYRDMFYMNIAGGIAAAGDTDRAKAILAKNFSGQRLTDSYNSLYQSSARRAIEKGEYDKALEYIEQVNPKTQYVLLTDLAVAVQAKTPNDNQKALTALERVRKTIPAVPATRDDFMMMGRLASAYALIEPKTGFRMLEILIKKYDELGAASALVESFQSEGLSSRKGELLLTNGNFRSLPIIFSLKNFVTKDFARTFKIIDSIKRLDLRINTRLQALESTDKFLGRQ